MPLSERERKIDRAVEYALYLCKARGKGNSRKALLHRWSESGLPPLQRPYMYDPLQLIRQRFRELCEGASWASTSAPTSENT